MLKMAPKQLPCPDLPVTPQAMSASTVNRPQARFWQLEQTKTNSETDSLFVPASVRRQSTMFPSPRYAWLTCEDRQCRGSGASYGPDGNKPYEVNNME